MDILIECGGFFFLFFLYGTSIENGQQGIKHNVLQLNEVADFTSNFNTKNNG
jgi:hypothetical protein